MLTHLHLVGQTPLFFDNFDQAPVNPIVSSGNPAANYTIWTTVTPATATGGTARVEEYAAGDGVLKLLAHDDKNTQTGNRTEVSAPLSVYNAPFNPTLKQNTMDLEWNFTLKQNRGSAGGKNGFDGSNTGLAVVLVSDNSTWGSQQGSLAKGYAVTFLKPTGNMYCASLSRFDGGLSNCTVIAGNKAEDVFSEFKTWVTVRVTYSKENNEWKLYFRDEYSANVKGDIPTPHRLKLIGSVIDSTFTKIEMSHFGFALNTPTSSVGADHNAMFIDDFAVNAVENLSEYFTLNTSSTGEGTVTTKPEADTHSFGTEVQLTAVPKEGYIFKEWSGDIKEYNNPINVVINSSMTAVANFIPEPQELSEQKKIIHYNEQLLEAVKNEIAENNTYFVNAYNTLISKANVALTTKANPVTNKPQTPPSGILNDYYSIGPYWWPDLTKADSLPWIWKDGKVNPMSRGDNTDQVRLSEFLNALESLTFAYYFSGETKYAFKAIELLNIWLVDGATKMNPNANYAQGVPGKAEGRRTGVIEFVKVHAIITAVQIMENKGMLPASTKTGVSKWLKDWSIWLTTNPLGIEEGNSDNNHATWYDFQVLGLLLYDGNFTDATTLAQDFKSKRIAPQIDPNGAQHREIRRTKSVNYSTMNLWAMTWVASIAEQTEIDLWDYQTAEGKSIKKAYSFLRPYVIAPSTWKWEQISNGGTVNAINTLTQPLFSKASTIFNQDLIPQIKDVDKNLSDIEKLVFPPRKQLLNFNTSTRDADLNDVNVFPNPNNGNFNIQLKNSNYKKITLVDIKGEIVFKQNTPNNLLNINLKVNPGLYVLLVQDKFNNSFRCKISIR